ncbi:hypothetical protein ATI61_107567 [Archangium gephyra]|uniref:Uncharacterized protein n=1 Tax=Archangium gephyra TaxID=48 RepID=A0AAC8QJ86_9BACT|nr:hypothetical protein [Archangium gephyra]AKJ08136.1 Hypothetical protein AA314_09762 [Archangium gephyra]REG29870.1 hypothetical protein ATI61_107567 [Archangium gephyra]
MTTPRLTSSRLSLLLLLLLAPGLGLAAQEESTAPRSTVLEPRLASSGLPGTDTRAPLRLRGDEGAPPEDARPSTALRILAETGAGLLTSLGGGVVGAFIGGGLCEAGITGSPSGFLPCLNSTATGLLLGGGAAFALGVWWGGEAAGGDGKLTGALLGFGTCAAAGLLLGLASGNPATGLLVAIPFSLIGSIIGYESTQREPAPGPGAPAPAVASARPRLQPVLAFSPRGTLVGLGGTF